MSRESRRGDAEEPALSLAEPVKRPAFVHERLFGGTGRVTVTDLLAGRTAEPFTAVLACELVPGGSVGAHVQREFAEIVIGIAGEGEASVNGRPEPLSPGDVIHLPLGATLELRNRSLDAPLSYLIVKAGSR